MDLKKKWLVGTSITLVLTLIIAILLFFDLWIDWGNKITGAVPFGALLTEQKSERGAEFPAEPDAARAGNVTEIDIFGYSLTQSWQGYFGNVTGTITLDDNVNNTMYNWSATSPEGEIFASNGSITWTNIQCFNFTATGLNANEFYNYTADVEQRGETNLYGKNLTELETEFGISASDMDGVDETFNFTYGADSHDSFYVGSFLFSEGECVFTRTYGDIGQGETNEFEEVILWDPDGNNTIFTAIVEEDVYGFDNATHDFQMMVLENEHLGDTATTDYNFYVELE